MRAARFTIALRHLSRNVWPPPTATPLLPCHLSLVIRVLACDFICVSCERDSKKLPKVLGVRAAAQTAHTIWYIWYVCIPHTILDGRGGQLQYYIKCNLFPFLLRVTRTLTKREGDEGAGEGEGAGELCWWVKLSSSWMNKWITWINGYLDGWSSRKLCRRQNYIDRHTQLVCELCCMSGMLL